MLQIKSFCFNPFQENTYLLYDESGEAAVVDPGCERREEREMLSNFIAEKHLRVVALVNTHCHIDHVLGNRYVMDTYGVPLLVHPDDVATLKANELFAPMYGFSGFEVSEPGGFLKHGDHFRFGHTDFEVLHVPGHSPGHIALYDPDSKSCIAGDVLFLGSVGRTDLPGGDHATLIDSIRRRLFALGDDVVVYPGHGPSTTIGRERRSNPFCGMQASGY
jgi:hydroxyacylglutathione hydrolase